MISLVSRNGQTPTSGLQKSIITLLPSHSSLPTSTPPHTTAPHPPCQFHGSYIVSLGYFQLKKMLFSLQTISRKPYVKFPSVYKEYFPWEHWCLSTATPQRRIVVEPKCIYTPNWIMYSTWLFFLFFLLDDKNDPI